MVLPSVPFVMSIQPPGEFDDLCFKALPFLCTPAEAPTYHELAPVFNMLRFLHLPLFLLWASFPPSFVTASDSVRSELPGLVTPKASVVIRATTTERVKQVLVEDGVWVEAGQPLVQFEDDLAKAALQVLTTEMSQRGQLAFAAADVEHTEQVLNRLLAVDQHHRLPQNDIDAARNALRKAQAALQSAEEELTHVKQRVELERIKLSRLTISSPISGMVSRVRVKSGAQPEATTELMRIVNLDRLTVELQISLSKYDRLKLGKSYQLRGQTPVERDVAATLTSIDPVLDAGSMTVRCVFEIDNSNGELPAGFLVLPPSELSPASHSRTVAVSKLSSP